MKLELPEICWHGDKERIMSIDFHPFQNLFVTGGTDSEEHKGFIKLWELHFEKSEAENKKPVFIGNLEYHQSTVNCVKFSYNGQQLASGSDDHNIIIWEYKSKNKEFGSNEQVLGWAQSKYLNGHSMDVIDLQWSINGKQILSGSVDNTARLWNVEKGKTIQTFTMHNHFVQGVCFEQRCKQILTQSSDRTVKVWRKKKKGKCFEFYHGWTLRKLDFPDQKEEKKEENMDKATTPQISEIPSTKELNVAKSFRLFLDEISLSSRPDWSPDGTFCVLPAAQYQRNKEEKPFACALVYRKNDFAEKPCMVLNTNNKPPICCKFSRKLFQKNPNKTSIFNLPQTMIFALATVDSVLVFSTQSPLPLQIVGNMHQAILTDLSWKKDEILAISSSDGQCSFLLFDKQNFGEEQNIELLPEKKRQPFQIEDYYLKNLPKGAKLPENQNAQCEKNEIKIQALQPIQPSPIISEENKQQVTIVTTESGAKKKFIKPVMLQKFE